METRLQECGRGLEVAFFLSRTADQPATLTNTISLVENSTSVRRALRWSAGRERIFIGHFNAALSDADGWPGREGVNIYNLRRDEAAQPAKEWHKASKVL